MSARDEVNGKVFGGGRDAVRVVGLRDADEETAGVDAGLGGETHETSRPATVGDGGHDEHRVVDDLDHLVERVRSGHTHLFRLPAI